MSDSMRSVFVPDMRQQFGFGFGSLRMTSTAPGVVPQREFGTRPSKSYGNHGACEMEGDGDGEMTVGETEEEAVDEVMEDDAEEAEAEADAEEEAAENAVMAEEPAMGAPLGHGDYYKGDGKHKGKGKKRGDEEMYSNADEAVRIEDALRLGGNTTLFAAALAQVASELN